MKAKEKIQGKRNVTKQNCCFSNKIYYETKLSQTLSAFTSIFQQRQTQVESCWRCQYQRDVKQNIAALVVIEAFYLSTFFWHTNEIDCLQMAFWYFSLSSFKHQCFGTPWINGANALFFCTSLYATLFFFYYLLMRLFRSLCHAPQTCIAFFSADFFIFLCRDVYSWSVCTI